MKNDLLRAIQRRSSHSALPSAGFAPRSDRNVKVFRVNLAAYTERDIVQADEWKERGGVGPLRYDQVRRAVDWWTPVRSDNRVNESVVALSKDKKRRKSRTLTGDVGEHLVVRELLKRGFDARRMDDKTRGYSVLVRREETSPKQVQVKTVRSPPWYMHRKSFDGARGAQVTVYVLLPVDMKLNEPRFFVAKNSIVASHFRQLGGWKDFGFIDLDAIEEHENNWDILIGF
jgi:hypothetical protein